MPPELDNLTEALQRHLGLQQAQTFEPENITGDAVARITSKRGDLTRLAKLWSAPEEVAQELVASPEPGKCKEPLLALRKVLDSSLVVNRYASGAPKTFLPFTPLFVSSRSTGTLYRDLGRSVVEGLWGRPGLADSISAIRAQILTWASQHPLALLLTALCKEQVSDKPKDSARLAAAIEQDSTLRNWVDRVVVQDWKAWLQVAPRLSVDEQVETMTSLIGLHLHIALLWRLGDSVPLTLAQDRPRVPPVFFVAIEGNDGESGVGTAAYHSCQRAAYNFIGFWRERAYKALEVVAGEAIEQTAKQDPALEKSLQSSDWTSPRVWSTIRIKGGKKSERAFNEYNNLVLQRLQEQSAFSTLPTRPNLVRLLVESLASPFGGESSVVDKVKDFLRGTGRAAGIVGPNDARSRRRYLLDERGVSILARLHATRHHADIMSDEQDPESVEAFLDDVFERYGLVVTTDRVKVQERLSNPGPFQKLQPLFPSEEAVRRNRAALDRRLDSLRLVRRYSDASAVITSLT